MGSERRSISFSHICPQRRMRLRVTLTQWIHICLICVRYSASYCTAPVLFWTGPALIIGTGRRIDSDECSTPSQQLAAKIKAQLYKVKGHQTSQRSAGEAAKTNLTTGSGGTRWAGSHYYFRGKCFFSEGENRKEGMKVNICSSKCLVKKMRRFEGNRLTSRCANRSSEEELKSEDRL